MRDRVTTWGVTMPRQQAESMVDAQLKAIERRRKERAERAKAKEAAGG